MSIEQLTEHRPEDGGTDGELDLYTEMAAIADTPAEHRRDRAMELARRLAHVDELTRQRFRERIRDVVPAVSKSDFDRIIRQELKAEKTRREDEARRLAAVTAAAILPEPTDPMAVGRELVDRLEHTDGVPHLSWWRGDFYRWTSARWEIQQDSTISRWLYLQTENAQYATDRGFYKGWAPTGGKINNLMEAMGTALLARPWGDDDVKCVAATNGVLDPSTRKLLAHTPRRFNLASLPFAYDRQATCPQWLAFLGQALGHDQEARQFLQEWFGYVISGRTDLQKMAHLFGARRSGKGTIARIIEAMVGPEAVAAPSLSSLSGPFGEQPLIGKSLAVLSDVNWNLRDIGEAVEILKKISGEDSRDVNRKNRETWHGKLGVRFMVIGNDEPQFTDASGALAGRMIHIKFTKSFFGQEDPTLTPRLMTELAGILNWALDGLDRLTKRGRFQVPTSSYEAEKEIRRLTSPVEGFIEDRAILDPRGQVPLNDLYGAYRDWCVEEEGQATPMKKSIFARSLRSTGNGQIDVKRVGRDKDRQSVVYGLAPQYPDAFVAKWLGGQGG